MAKASQEQKIVNQISFIKNQMQQLSNKLEDLELFENVDHLEGLIDAYDVFEVKTRQAITKKQGAANE